MGVSLSLWVQPRPGSPASVFQETLHWPPLAFARCNTRIRFQSLLSGSVALHRLGGLSSLSLLLSPVGDPTSLCLTQLGQGGGAGMAAAAAAVPSPGLCLSPRLWVNLCRKCGLGEPCSALGVLPACQLGAGLVGEGSASCPWSGAQALGLSEDLWRAGWRAGGGRAPGEKGCAYKPPGWEW